MIEAPRMLMIGAAGRNVGKTELACLLIKKFSADHDIVGIKVTTIQERRGACPRGEDGCGVCSSLEGVYSITQEVDAGGEKDTQRLLAAGACRVYWLRVLREHLGEGAAALFKTVGADAVTICESNSLRTVVEPGVFLMVRRRDAEQFKPSARDVRRHADRLVVFGGRDFDLDLDDVDMIDSEWLIRLPAGAIVLAGGKSERMRRRNKGMLLIEGRPIIEHICAQLRPHFERILVSANDADEYASLGVETVADKVPGQGPLMAIASALEVSSHDLNLVVACDIPEVNMVVVRRMMREAEGYDAVVPVTGESHIEPLFAVYRKSMLDPMRTTLAAGKRKIRDAFELCSVKYVDLVDARWLRNLNTREDYERFVSQRGSSAAE